MNSFFKDLFGNSDDTSHKRLIAVGAFLVLVSMVVIKAVGCEVDDQLIYVFAGLTGGQSLLSVVDKHGIKKKE